MISRKLLQRFVFSSVIAVVALISIPVFLNQSVQVAAQTAVTHSFRFPGDTLQDTNMCPGTSNQSQYRPQFYSNGIGDQPASTERIINLVDGSVITNGQPLDITAVEVDAHDHNANMRVRVMAHRVGDPPTVWQYMSDSQNGRNGYLDVDTNGQPDPDNNSDTSVCEMEINQLFCGIHHDRNRSSYTARTNPALLDQCANPHEFSQGVDQVDKLLFRVQCGNECGHVHISNVRIYTNEQQQNTNVCGYVRGRSASSQATGLPLVPVDVVITQPNTDPRTTRVFTDSSGRFNLSGDNAIPEGATYSVRLPGNSANPQTAPAGYNPPGTTTSNLGNGLSYENQNPANTHCADDCNCNFLYNTDNQHPQCTNFQVRRTPAGNGEPVTVQPGGTMMSTDQVYVTHTNRDGEGLPDTSRICWSAAGVRLADLATGRNVAACADICVTSGGQRGRPGNSVTTISGGALVTTSPANGLSTTCLVTGSQSNSVTGSVSGNVSTFINYLPNRNVVTLDGETRNLRELAAENGLHFMQDAYNYQDNGQLFCTTNPYTGDTGGVIWNGGNGNEITGTQCGRILSGPLSGNNCSQVVGIEDNSETPPPTGNPNIPVTCPLHNFGSTLRTDVSCQDCTPDPGNLSLRLGIHNLDLSTCPSVPLMTATYFIEFTEMNLSEQLQQQVRDGLGTPTHQYDNNNGTWRYIIGSRSASTIADLSYFWNRTDRLANGQKTLNEVAVWNSSNYTQPLKFGTQVSVGGEAAQDIQYEYLRLTPNGCHNDWTASTTETIPLPLTEFGEQSVTFTRSDGDNFEDMYAQWRQPRHTFVTGYELALKLAANGESIASTSFSISNPASGCSNTSDGTTEDYQINIADCFASVPDFSLNNLKNRILTTNQAEFYLEVKPLGDDQTYTTNICIADPSVQYTVANGLEPIEGTARSGQIDALARLWGNFYESNSSVCSTDGDTLALSSPAVSAGSPIEQNLETANTGYAGVIPLRGTTVRVSHDADSDNYQCAGGCDQSQNASGEMCIADVSDPTLPRHFWFFDLEEALSNARWWQQVGGITYGNDRLQANLPVLIDGASIFCGSNPNCFPFLLRSRNFTEDRSAGVSISRTLSIPDGGWETEHTGRPFSMMTSSQADQIVSNLGVANRYAALLTLVRQTEDVTDISDQNIGTLPANSGYYRYTGPLTVGTNTTISVSSTQKIVIFVEGSLTLDHFGALENNRLITVEEGGFLAFIVRGDINISESVGQSLTGEPENFVTAGTEDLAQLEGMYLADGTLTIQGNGSSTEPDRRFIGSGTFVGWNDVVLDRSFARDGENNYFEYNGYSPSEIFHFRPDLLTNTPDALRRSSMVYQEIN